MLYPIELRALASTRGMTPLAKAGEPTPWAFQWQVLMRRFFQTLCKGCKSVLVAPTGIE